MRQLAFVGILALVSLAPAQALEYAIYQVFVRSDGGVHAFYDRSHYETGHSASSLLEALGAPFEASVYGRLELLAVLNYLGSGGWEVWRVTEDPEVSGLMTRYYLKRSADESRD
jgi:hypothetical protein